MLNYDMEFIGHGEEWWRKFRMAYKHNTRIGLWNIVIIIHTLNQNVLIKANIVKSKLAS